METAKNPVPGIDYPRTFQEMDEWFATEAACRNYIRRLRWPDGFVCRRCGTVGEPWVTARGVLHCQACDGETSLTAGTVFQDTRKPLRLWFLAMWFVTSQKNGISALGLQRVLGLGSYETAWTWLHKLRRAMVRSGRETERKAIVAVAAEKSGRGIGRIRLRRIKDVSADSLLPFIQSVVAPGSVVHTDGWCGYSGLADAGYKHQITVISGGPEPAHEVMPRVHTVASLLKRWLLGTHQGGTQHKHLDYYLDEFAFRFNRRRSQARGLLFHRLAQQAVAAGPAPYSTIIGTAPAK